MSRIPLGWWVYHNPYANARLYDDEIAVGTCMDKMAQYAHGVTYALVSEGRVIENIEEVAVISDKVSRSK